MPRVKMYEPREIDRLNKSTLVEAREMNGSGNAARRYAAPRNDLILRDEFIGVADGRHLDSPLEGPSNSMDRGSTRFAVEIYLVRILFYRRETLE